MNQLKLKYLSGKNKPNKIIDKKGYVMVYSPSNPFSKHGYILEHRLVMESYIGRLLTKDEKVHHDDFNKENNSIRNLTLFPNNSSHSHFHRQIKQFGMTTPRIIEIKALKDNMLNERLKNMVIE